MANTLLALAYDDVNERKAERLRECAVFLEFTVLEDGNKKLKTMNSCRVRLCPLCAWRRSLKVYHNTKAIMTALEGKYAFLFLTLTVRNCKGSELSETIDLMMAAWNRFVQRKAIKQAVKGWYRGLEITHNTDPKSPNYDTFHPHFHVAIAVNKSYFKNRQYISQEAWVDMWQQSAKLDYKPIVDIRKTYGNTAKDVAEVAKYSVKDGDFIFPDDWDLTVDTVRTLDEALNNRRFVAYGGEFKELHKLLNLEDEEDGDLIHVDEDSSTAAATDKTQFFFWHTGYNQYIRDTNKEQG